jgi:hypothetical protein
MSYCFTAILFEEEAFSQDFILSAIKKTEEAFPEPHPHPGEYYVKVPIKNSIMAIFYLVNGYSLKTERFECQREFFQEDDFLGLVWESAQESGQPFRFYARIYNDMAADYGVVYRFDHERMNQVQMIDGSGYIYYSPEDEQHRNSWQTFSKKMSKPKQEQFYRQYSDALFLEKELGITDADLIKAFMAVDKGEIIFKYPA